MKSIKTAVITDIIIDSEKKVQMNVYFRYIGTKQIKLKKYILSEINTFLKSMLVNEHHQLLNKYIFVVEKYIDTKIGRLLTDDLFPLILNE